MRLFAALILPELMRERLVLLQDGLPARRLVPPENFHITLCYMGECNRHTAQDLLVSLGQIQSEPLDVSIEGVGVFGEPRARVIHSHVDGGSQLVSLRNAVVSAARSVGVDLKHRRFVPHVTLSRAVPSERNAPRLGEWVAARTAVRAGPFEVSSFALFESEIGKSGPHYRALTTYDLWSPGLQRS